jgi:hypothetical protein
MAWKTNRSNGKVYFGAFYRWKVNLPLTSAMVILLSPFSDVILILLPGRDSLVESKYGTAYLPSGLGV